MTDMTSGGERQMRTPEPVKPKTRGHLKPSMVSEARDSESGGARDEAMGPSGSEPMEDEMVKRAEELQR